MYFCKGISMRPPLSSVLFTNFLANTIELEVLCWPALCLYRPATAFAVLSVYSVRVCACVDVCVLGLMLASLAISCFYFLTWQDIVLSVTTRVRTVEVKHDAHIIVVCLASSLSIIAYLYRHSRKLTTALEHRAIAVCRTVRWDFHLSMMRGNGAWNTYYR